MDCVVAVHISGPTPVAGVVHRECPRSHIVACSICDCMGTIDKKGHGRAPAPLSSGSVPVGGLWPFWFWSSSQISIIMDDGRARSKSA